MKPDAPNPNVTQSLEPSRESRICMPVFSSFARNAFRAGLYEAQDVLASCADVDVIPLEPSWGFATKSQWMMRLVYHDISRKLVSFNPGLKPTRLVKDYDVFVLVCPLWSDVWYANAIEGWRDRCRKSICWIDELWAHEVRNLDRWLPVLDQFDYIFVGIAGTEAALSEALGRRCYDVSGAVDALRFSPFPRAPKRVIDFYSIGRRLEGMHRRLAKCAEENQEFFYLYDTLHNSGDRAISDYRQHREMYANIAKRSRFFAVAPGKVTAPEGNHGQVDLGFRYFEGSAAGTVLVGQVPDCDAFRRHFDWPHAVIEVQPDGSDIIEVLSKLAAEPERLHEISCRNSEEALRRHDWIYRWKEILSVAGLDSGPAINARERALAELAESAKFERENVTDAFSK